MHLATSSSHAILARQCLNFTYKYEFFSSPATKAIEIQEGCDLSQVDVLATKAFQSNKGVIFCYFSIYYCHERSAKKPSHLINNHFSNNNYYFAPT